MANLDATGLAVMFVEWTVGYCTNRFVKTLVEGKLQRMAKYIIGSVRQLPYLGFRRQVHRHRWVVLRVVHCVYSC